ncbi:MAG: hypothetical protein K6T91_07745 [Firmicutes bacterium]|nr:hypothetical protein [Bacillota bacterium]
MLKPSVTNQSSTGRSDNIIPERRIFQYALILAVVTTLLSLGSIWIEINKTLSPKQSKTSGLEQILPKRLKPPVPVINMLPDFILQYETKARQDVAGSEYPASEAIYENLDPNLMLRAPCNSYAKVTYFASEEDAKKDVADTLAKRFPNGHENLLIGTTIVKTGYTEREDSFFMGWTKQNYSIRIITSFLEHAPVEKGNILKNHAMPIAQAIITGAGTSNKPQANKQPSGGQPEEGKSK